MDPAAPLPTGTVTFLLTDIEGSTRLWERHRDAMQGAVAVHDALLRSTIETHGGMVFKAMGDAFFAAFSTAPPALAAALGVQRSLQTTSWGETGPLPVRMALHTGAAELRGGDYFGMPLSRAARLLAAGHGGQVLVSQATRDLLRGALPAGATWRDLGAHRLKDLLEPEHIFQLLHPELPAGFSPLRSLEAFAHNLPRQLTSFIGREPEIAAVQQLLAHTCLLTLTGAGGSGKTRLALQVAGDLLEQFTDGVWLVELAALSDPALVPQSVAAALGAREQPGRPLLQTLIDYLRPRQLLLLFDNCEHLLSATAQLAETLLRACPQLRVLATSREGLAIAGETAYRVPSLSLPPAEGVGCWVGSGVGSEPVLPNTEHPGTRAAGDPYTLLHYEAVRLFIDRATAAVPSFAVTNQNATAVAQVCHRLDGIPLAIELASARVKLLPVEQIAARLDDRFRLLTGGSRTALPRQQTLRALVDWSYDLLSEAERALLCRLSVFSGGWTLEAAEAVCGAGVGGSGLGVGSDPSHPSDLSDPLHPTPNAQPPTPNALCPDDVLDLLGRLVDKSLVQVAERAGEARYHLLETIRQYGVERLQTSGDEAVWRDRHRDWCLQLAEQAEPELRGPSQQMWLSRLEAEHENLRGALAWCVKAVGSGQPGGVRTESEPVFAGTTHSPLPTAHCALPTAAEAALRLAGALGQFWSTRGYLTEGRERLAAVLALPGTEAGTAARGKVLDAAGGMAGSQGEYEAARSLLREGLAIFQELEDRRGVAASLLGLGWLARTQGDREAAQALLEESLAISRQVGDQYGVANSLSSLGYLARLRGEYETARALLEESLAIGRQTGDQWSIAASLSVLALVANLQADYEAARALSEESLAIYRQLGDRESAPFCLYTLGLACSRLGDYPKARECYEEGLAISRAVGNATRIIDFLGFLGHLERDAGDYARCAAYYRESLAHRRLIDIPFSIPQGLEDFAGLAGRQGQWERAIRLLGAVQEAARRIGRTPPLSALEEEYHRTVDGARQALGEEAFAAAWTAGEALSLDEAVAFALEESPED